jgi:hypothetical protein
MFLVIHIVGVQVQEHLCARYRGNTSANNALNLRESLQELGFLGSASSGRNGAIDGDTAKTVS